MSKEERISYYLFEAEKFHRAAVEELSRWELERKDEIIRDAAEKAWNAIVQATNALLIAKGVEEERIRSHRERRLALAQLELKDLTVKQKGFSDRYSAREYKLHALCFYEGEYVPEAVKEDVVEKVRRYIEDVKAIAGLEA